MGDRAVSSQVCIGNGCFDLNTVQDGGFSGSPVHWGPSEQSFASKPPGTVCREVNGVMVCTNIYAESNISNFGPASTTPVERTAARDNIASSAVGGFHDVALESFPSFVPPQLAAQYGERTQNNVARVNYTEAAPAYYTPQANQDVYKGPSYEQPQSYDAYSFHQGQRPIDAAVAQPFDPYSFHQGGDRRVAPQQSSDATQATTDSKPAPVVTQTQPEVQPPVRTCTPGGCPGQCHPRQGQFNPCRPCNQSRQCGGWYPGKVVGRIFGGRGRCR